MKNIRILLLEDDPYARDMMAMLFARDWRTRMVGELAHPRDPYDLQPYLDQNIDLVVMDVENPHDSERPFHLAKYLSQIKNTPRILYTATQAEPWVMERVLPFAFGGFLVKSEIGYALATAAAVAVSGFCALTPAADDASQHLDLPKPRRVLAGGAIGEDLPPRTAEILRLALLFNLSQRDIADELVVSPGWVAEAISDAYNRLGLAEILSGETAIEGLFNTGDATRGERLILERCRAILERVGPRDESGRVRKAPWMSTLAYHLLTRPKI